MNETRSPSAIKRKVLALFGAQDTDVQDVEPSLEEAPEDVEAVPVPHDDPVGTIPDPAETPAVEDNLLSPEMDPSEGPSTEYNVEPDTPADGGDVPGSRELVQEYSTKTTDVTGKPALNAEELDEINSLLGTATFTFGDTTYDVVRLGGTWYIKGEKPDDGEGSSDSGAEDSQEEDSDEAPGEADNESPAEAEEGDEEAEEEEQDNPQSDEDESIDGDAPGDGGSDESEEPDEEPDEEPEEETAGRVLSSLRGSNQGFAIVRDRLAPQDPEFNGNENPSQVGVQAPSMAKAGRDYSRSTLRGHIKEGSAFAVEHRRAELASKERECVVDALKVLRAHFAGTK